MFTALVMTMMAPAFGQANCNTDADCGGVTQCIDSEPTVVESDCWFWPFCSDDGSLSSTDFSGECGHVQIQSDDTGDCLRPLGAIMDAGMVINGEPCQNLKSFLWDVLPTDDGLAFRNRWTKLCLSSTGSEYDQQPCVKGVDQRFDLSEESDGTFRIFHAEEPDSCMRDRTSYSFPRVSTTCDQYDTRSRRWFIE